jgi:UDP-N-acetylmuramate dehydrogenase
MNIQENFNLKSYNTLGVQSIARYYTEINNQEDIKALMGNQIIHSLPVLILGSGSNILFTNNFEGFVIKNNLMGIEVIEEDKEKVYVKVNSGENWSSFVDFCTDKGYYGLENLTMIPGTVGATPVQNIGAYGVELEDYFYKLDALELHSHKIKTLNLKDCDFGYRDSIFKSKYRGKYFILSVTFKLSKKPVLKTDYDDVKNEIAAKGITDLTPHKLKDIIACIRANKLPDPAHVKNAGSFFKNPVVKDKFFNELKADYPDIRGIHVDSSHIKIPAAWLIEQTGWKAVREGNVGVYSKHSLVLVNHGNASGKEIYDFACRIIDSVHIQFGIDLEFEVNVI